MCSHVTGDTTLAGMRVCAVLEANNTDYLPYTHKQLFIVQQWLSSGTMLLQLVVLYKLIGTHSTEVGLETPLSIQLRCVGGS